MPKQIVHSDAAPQAIGIYSQAVRADDTALAVASLPRGALVGVEAVLVLEQ